MRARRHWYAAVAALAVTLVAASCGTPSSGSAGGNDDATNIVLGVGNEPDTLNPVLGYAPNGASKIFDGLVSYDAELNPVPELAKKLPERSDNGTTYTYQLRHDVTFHDGTPLTSSDVAFTYRKVLDEDVNSTIASNYAAIDSIETPDKYTVVFHLKYPYAPFTKRTTLGIVPKHLLAGKDIDGAKFNRHPVGSGPYEFVEWRAGDRLVLKANKNYWGPTPEVTRVTIPFIPDDSTRAARLASGELDGAALPPKLAKRFQGDSDPGSGPNLVVRSRDTADYRGIVMPMDNPVTSERAVRRAMNIAVNRKAMVEGLLLGHGTPAYGPLPPSHPWYNEDIETSYNPERAEKILREAGWHKTSDGVRAKDGTPARFTLMYPAGDDLRKSLAIAFSDQMAKIGIDVKLRGLSWDAISPRMNTDAVVYGTGTPYDPDFVSYDIYHSSVAGEGLLNPGEYKNPEADAALEKGRHSSDPEVRQAAYEKLQRVQHRDPAMIFLVYLDHLYVMRDAWTGIEPQPEPHAHGLLHGPWWNLAEWKPKS